MRTPKELFGEIVKLAASIGQEPEASEEVVLSEEQAELAEKPAMAEPAPSEEMPKEEEPKNDYVTRSEYEAALRELKEMYAKVLEVVSPSESQDVPAELSKEGNVELSEETPSEQVEQQAEAAPAVEVKSEEPASDDLIHTPDADVKEKPTYLYGQQRVKTTQDYVFASIFNKK